MAVLLRGLRHRFLLSTVRQAAVCPVIVRTSHLESKCFVELTCPKCGGSILTTFRSLATKMSWQDEAEEELQLRNARIMNGFVLILFCVGFGAYYVLWYFRKKQFKYSKEDLPDPLDWEDFLTDYLSKEKVQKVLFFPDFNVADVYLKRVRKETEKEKQGLKLFLPFMFKDTSPPNLRFWFGGTTEELKESLENGLLDVGSTEDVELITHSFPDKYEIAFIAVSVLFATIFIASALRARGIGTKWRR